jgi:hypothetical protein
MAALQRASCATEIRSMFAARIYTAREQKS